jgi:hypothetical protein
MPSLRAQCRSRLFFALIDGRARFLDDLLPTRTLCCDEIGEVVLAEAKDLLG